MSCRHRACAVAHAWLSLRVLRYGHPVARDVAQWREPDLERHGTRTRGHDVVHAACTVTCAITRARPRRGRVGAQPQVRGKMYGSLWY